jgi:hypothetical protein
VKSNYCLRTLDDLEHLLDKLTAQVAARDAHGRWPSWTFTRTISGWQAKEIDGPELFVAPALDLVEARVAQHERINGPGQQGTLGKSQQEQSIFPLKDSTLRLSA